MAANTLTCTVIPTGGIVKLLMGSADTTGTWTLTRTAPSGAPYTLYSGPPLGLPDTSCMWLDTGDGLNQPLDAGFTYAYSFTTLSGTVSESVQPTCAIEIAYDDYLRLLVRVLQAGINSLVPPSGTAFPRKPVVFVSMPLTGTPPIPCISVNEDSLTQSIVPIGHGINTDTANNFFDISEIVDRRYRVTIITSSTDERVFYEFAVIAMFKAILSPLLESMGQNITTSFQAASSQVVDTPPGFYFCEIALTVSGDMPLKINTNYGVFGMASDYSANASQQVTIEMGTGVVSPLVVNGGVIMMVPLSTLPADPAGLPSGTWWNNGGSLAQVP